MRTLILLLCSSLLAAQPDAVTWPRLCTDLEAPHALALPLARSRSFVQFWYAAGTALPRTFHALGWRADIQVESPGQWQDLEIVVSSSPRGCFELSPRFAENLDSDAVTLARTRRYALPPLVAGQRDPRQATLWIPADQPAILRGPNLLVQVEATTTFLPMQTEYAVDAYVQWAGDEPLDLHGRVNCGASLRVVTSSSQWSAQLTRAMPITPVVWLLGDTRVEASMEAFGLPGCTLQVMPLVVLSAQTDLFGTARLTLPLTNPMRGHLAIQAVHGTTPGFSNAATTAFGVRGLSNYLYNWTRFGPEAEYGPFDSGRGPVLLSR